MAEVSIRELRNEGGSVIERVLAGELVTITRAGAPVAQLRPVDRSALTSVELIGRWRGVPKVDLASLRADAERFLDVGL